MSSPEARALRRCALAASPARPWPSNTPMATAEEAQAAGADAESPPLLLPLLQAAPAASGSARNES